MKPLSWYKELVDPGHRREYGYCIVEGSKAIEQIALCAPSLIIEILSTGDHGRNVRLSGFSLRTLSDRQFKSLAFSKTPRGIAAVVKIPEESYSGTLPSRISGRILLLEGVQDPGNVGTLIRTAGAFGYRGVILSDGCADPFSPKAVQGSAGAMVSLWIRRTSRYLDLVKEIAAHGYRIFAATLDGRPITSVKFPPGHLLMLGSEGQGLSPKIVGLAGETVAIPMDRTKAESLNVAVAGGILMYCGSNKK